MVVFYSFLKCMRFLKRSLLSICTGVVAAIMLAGCADPENRLVGIWASNDAKTLSKLLETVGDNNKYADCYRKKICGNYSFEYTKDEYFVYFDGVKKDISKESERIKYEIIDQNKKSVLVKHSNDKSEHRLWYSDDGIFVNELGFKEFFVKVEYGESQ